MLHGSDSFSTHGCKRLGYSGVKFQNGPVGVVSLSSKDKSTCFPSPALRACSWDKSLEEEIGASIASEAASKGIDLLLTPDINVKRNPLAGRNFESYSEDPLLSGILGSGFVNGVQSNGIGACLKYFACNHQESYRYIDNAAIDERALNEIYLKPFEIVVKESKPWSVLASKNLINDVHCADNEYLLKEILKENWVFEGVVVSDLDAVYDPIYCHSHGLDIEMPCNYNKRTNELMRATKEAEIHATSIFESSKRIINMLDKVKKSTRPASFDVNAQHELAKRSALESIVLLRNEDGFLPLAKTLPDCCVIGELAKFPVIQGQGQSNVIPNNVVSFMDVIDSALPFEQGYNLNGVSDPNLILNAADLASRSKRVLLFLGLPSGKDKEGKDREDTNLPENQLALFDAISAVNSNIVVILSCGAPVSLPFRDKAKAILLTYYGGEAIGEALLSILTGETSPSGKLAETWPMHLSDVPSFGFYPGYQGRSLYKESIYVGYRYYLTSNVPVAYPFGYGLSYCRFSYSFNVNSKVLNEGEKLEAEIKITNRSSRSGKTVVQLYVESSRLNAFRPKRVLVGFAKISLEAYESKTITIPVDYSSFAIFNPSTHCFEVEKGLYSLALGTSCQDIVSSFKIEVNGKEDIPSLREQCPAYYAVHKGGFSQYDDEFEYLLHRNIGQERDLRERPYDKESMMTHISWTHVGKRLKRKFLASNQTLNPSSPTYEEDLRIAFYDLPLRASSLHKGSSKDIQVLVDEANGRYFFALIHKIFGTKSNDPYPSKKK